MLDHIRIPVRLGAMAPFYFKAARHQLGLFL
jgi:hypothetical protein